MLRRFLSILFFVFFGFSAGALMVRYSIFPFGSGLTTFLYQRAFEKREKSLPSSVELTRICYKHILKFSFYADAAPTWKHNGLFFVGDSLVDQLWNHELFPIRYSRFANSGNTVRCLPFLADEILRLKPRKILLYLGGNDADRVKEKGLEDFSAYTTPYTAFVEKMMQNGVTMILHGIHIGTAHRRDRSFVERFNREIKALADRKGLLYIPPLETFDYKDQRIGPGHPLTYDGEHLKYQGYRVWFDHIRQYVDDF